MRLFSLCCIALLCSVMLTVSVQADENKASLVERLGFPADAQVLIINGDDFGMNHSSNEGSNTA